MKSTVTKHSVTTSKGLQLEIDVYSNASQEEVDALIAPFKKEKGMSWLHNEHTYWIIGSVNGSPVGVVAFMAMQGGTEGRCKSDVVLDIVRGLGVYSALSEIRLELANSLNINYLTAFAGSMSKGQFLKDGFKEKTLTRHGVSFMVKS